MLVPNILYADYMSETTHFMHLLVMDVTNLFMYIMELLSAALIVGTTIIAFYKLFRKKPYARVYLLHGQSVGLSFKLGAEILKTITAQNLDEMWEIILLIIIKAAMMLLIEWELKGVENPYGEESFTSTRKDKHQIQSLLHPILNQTEKGQEPTREELIHLRHQLDKIIDDKSEQESIEKEQEAYDSHEPIL